MTTEQLVCFHKNEFDEMLCKLDYKQNPTNKTQRCLDKNTLIYARNMYL